MTQQYEYVVVELPRTAAKTREQQLTEKINSVAEHGWRLHLTQATFDPFAKTPTEYAIFERPVNNGD